MKRSAKTMKINRSLSLRTKQWFMCPRLFPKLHLINFSFSIKQVTVISILIVVLTGSLACLETLIWVFARASPSAKGLWKMTNSLTQTNCWTYISVPRNPTSPSDWPVGWLYGNLCGSTDSQKSPASLPWWSPSGASLQVRDSRAQAGSLTVGIVVGWFSFKRIIKSKSLWKAFWVT